MLILYDARSRKGILRAVGKMRKVNMEGKVWKGAVERWVKCVMWILRMWTIVCPRDGIVNSCEWACVVC